MADIRRQACHGGNRDVGLNRVEDLTFGPRRQRTLTASSRSGFVMI